jgi:hypothetical protein
VIGGLGRFFRILKERCARSLDLQVFAAFLERGLHPLTEIAMAAVSGWLSIQRKCLRIGVKRGITATWSVEKWKSNMPTVQLPIVKGWN